MNPLRGINKGLCYFILLASKERLKGSEVTVLFTIAPLLECDDVTVTAAMTSPERLLYWIMIWKKNIKNFQGFQGYVFWECFCFFFSFLPCFTSSNVKCMKSITSSVIPTSRSYESVLGQMVYQSEKKKTLEFVVICLDYCLDWRAGGAGKQKHKKTRWLYFTAVWVVQTGSAPPWHKMICFDVDLPF